MAGKPLMSIGPENYLWLELACELRRERLGLNDRDEWEAEQDAADEEPDGPPILTRGEGH